MKNYSFLNKCLLVYIKCLQTFAMLIVVCIFFAPVFFYNNRRSPICKLWKQCTMLFIIKIYFMLFKFNKYEWCFEFNLAPSFETLY